MDARRKQELNELMVTAWNLARFGANRFGGPASLYLWMGIVPRQEKVKRGQIMLPGLA